MRLGLDDRNRPPLRYTPPGGNGKMPLGCGIFIAVVLIIAVGIAARLIFG